MGQNKANYKKKKMSPETKEKIKTGFLTLISNDACIKAGREYHWYTPVILAICSLVITLIPNFVSTMQVNMGDSVLGTSNNVGGVENGLADFAKQLVASAAHVQISEDGTLTVGDADKKAIYNKTDHYEYVDSTTEEPVFRVAFSTETDEILSESLTALSTFEVETTLNSSASDSSSASTAKTKYRVSALVFKKSGFTLGIYKRRLTSTSSAFVDYSYDRLKGVDLVKYLTADISSNAAPSEYVSGVLKNFQKLLTSGYETTKVTVAWRNTGILAGINGGVILLLGLVLFLVTRGKRNPYRVITFWQAQKIGYWAAPLPALLAMGFGFFLSSQASFSSISMFIFLFLYGMRIMWMSMKAFSPQGK